MSFEMDDDIEQGLVSLGEKARRLENKAVREGARVFAEDLKKNTPYETASDRSWKAQRDMDKLNGRTSVFKHLRDDIQVSGIDHVGHVNVGFGKDTYWRAHFVEMGTINQRPQGFIQRTIVESDENVNQAMSDVLKKGLGL